MSNTYSHRVATQSQIKHGSAERFRLRIFNPNSFAYRLATELSPSEHLPQISVFMEKIQFKIDIKNYMAKNVTFDEYLMVRRNVSDHPVINEYDFLDYRLDLLNKAVGSLDSTGIPYELTRQQHESFMLFMREFDCRGDTRLSFEMILGKKQLQHRSNET